MCCVRKICLGPPKVLWLMGLFVLLFMHRLSVSESCVSASAWVSCLSLSLRLSRCNGAGKQQKKRKKEKEKMAPRRVLLTGFTAALQTTAAKSLPNWIIQSCLFFFAFLPWRQCTFLCNRNQITAPAQPARGISKASSGSLATSMMQAGSDRIQIQHSTQGLHETEEKKKSRLYSESWIFFITHLYDFCCVDLHCIFTP